MQPQAGGVRAWGYNEAGGIWGLGSAPLQNEHAAASHSTTERNKVTVAATTLQQARGRYLMAFRKNARA
jgi:hypothetical protein